MEKLDLNQKVFNFFKDEDKTELWFRTDNPSLGGVSPNYMIEKGRIERLTRFIDEAMTHNKEVDMSGEFNNKSKVRVSWSEPDADPLDIPVFKKYDMVVKDTGDYTFSGAIIAIMGKVEFDDDGDFKKDTGIYRYAVQNNQGAIHIFNSNQLKLDEDYQ